MSEKYNVFLILLLKKSQQKRNNFFYVGFRQRKKKMSTPQNLPNYGNNLALFYPAQLKHYASGWLIEYSAINPVTKDLQRKQVKLNRLFKKYASEKKAKAHAERMVLILNQKLLSGWNPFFSKEDARLYTPLSTVAELFLTEKKKELRVNSYRSYSSFINSVLKWVEKNNPGVFMSMFMQLSAVQYMDDLYSSSSVGITTYNNHIKMGRAFFNWAKEKCYTKENPFDAIKTKPKPDKTRVIIPVDVRKKITEDLQANNPNFLLMCKLFFNALIRPNELKQLTVSNVNLIKRFVHIPAHIAKNHKERYCTINADIIAGFEQMNLSRYPDNYFLFGSGLVPDKTAAGNGRYGEEWEKLRKRLKFAKEMQMYSLRDSGINAMLKSGIDDLSVMQHADHSSLEMTTLYGDHYDPNLNNLIYEKSPKF